MDDYIPISFLNDFIFCPYSIYLHNIYIDTDEDIYHSIYQIRGRYSHTSVDIRNESKEESLRETSDLRGISVYSEKFGLLGKIDVYNPRTGELTERKYKLSRIFKGHYYQLWAQYFCMMEMGYDVKTLSFYEISTNKRIKIEKPTECEVEEFGNFIAEMRNFDLSSFRQTNMAKCNTCIYSNLCDRL